jgi:glutamate racemase
MADYSIMVLDWGIGGLPLFEKLKAALPGISMLYLSDAGTEPYGKLGEAELSRRFERIALFVAGLGIPRIAVACNAMSSVLPGAVSSAGGVEVLSLIHHYLESPLPEGRSLGVIGGNRVIQSGIYQRALSAAGNRVRALATQELSALIEAGRVEAFCPFMGKTLAALGDIDGLVFACTHYPAAAPAIKGLRPSLELIDPGEALFDHCVKKLRAAVDSVPQNAPAETRCAERVLSYYTTGDAELSQKGAERAFGFSALPFRTIPRGLEP